MWITPPINPIFSNPDQKSEVNFEKHDKRMKNKA